MTFGRTTTAFEARLEELLVLCEEAELVDLGHVAHDGRRVPVTRRLRANITRDEVRDQVEEIIEEAERIDGPKDDSTGAKAREMNSPKYSAIWNSVPKRFRNFSPTLTSKSRAPRTSRLSGFENVGRKSGRPARRNGV